MSYKLHLPDDAYDALERDRASDEGMPLPPQDAPISIQTAYSEGRKETYRAIGKRPRNPYREPRLHEAWDNGRADELESFA